VVPERRLRFPELRDGKEGRQEKKKKEEMNYEKKTHETSEKEESVSHNNPKWAEDKDNCLWG
jgi:hypothetical protein